MKEIILYPGNWLYNAGVVGFLRVLEATGRDVRNLLYSDGTVKISDSDFPNSLFKTEKVDGVRCFFQENGDVLLSEKKKQGIDGERFYLNYVGCA